MALKITTREVGNVTVVTCNGRIVFGEEAADLRVTYKREFDECGSFIV